MLAILEITHNSEEQGNGLADVLLGDYNPTGRQPQNLGREHERSAAAMDYGIRSGRTYLYVNTAPLCPFRFGLSYPSFRPRTPRENTSTLTAASKASVEVTNTATMAGDEVVQ
ncbi:glycoside hydrolase family 3 C-terminal domain-containing protein [Acidipila sp. EB88]|uniref:glycoside hydrolase family 3 C-terminal domain-containing protein n=1 Tax=Acidipila sp. EB88 TaxID=2305226 RepID=UPI0013150374|nr:glycoside hydrolase family 3 C-terminal domain-containing protein [Acidipila sp. EB88]